MGIHGNLSFAWPPTKIGLAKRCQVHCEIGPLKTTPVAECLALMKAIESPRRVPGCSGFSVSRCFQMFPRSGKIWVCILHILVCVHMVKHIDLFSKKC